MVLEQPAKIFKVICKEVLLMSASSTQVLKIGWSRLSDISQCFWDGRIVAEFQWHACISISYSYRDKLLQAWWPINVDSSSLWNVSAGPLPPWSLCGRCYLSFPILEAACVSYLRGLPLSSEHTLWTCVSVVPSHFSDLAIYWLRTEKQNEDWKTCSELVNCKAGTSLALCVLLVHWGL